MINKKIYDFIQNTKDLQGQKNKNFLSAPVNRKTEF